MSIENQPVTALYMNGFIVETQTDLVEYHMHERMHLMHLHRVVAKAQCHFKIKLMFCFVFVFFFTDLNCPLNS